ncbi:MAG TPA: SRPBCC family protein [Ktedonobacterales bacterium]|nr:SRPBCC family protein [Ktedonobacterales bacterium]
MDATPPDAEMMCRRREMKELGMLASDRQTPAGERSALAGHGMNSFADQSAPRQTEVSSIERGLAVAGGAGLAIFGLTRASKAGMALAAAGALLAVRGARGRSHVWAPPGRGGGGARPMRFAKSVTIGRPASEVYAFWHDFANLPRFMRHLERVTPQGDGRSHWVARIPAGNTVEWDAEITADRENELIAWRSLAGATIANQGEVRFVPAPGGRGTEVHATIRYELPAGTAGKVAAKLANVVPAQEVKDDLLRLKEVLEAGEVATTAGQPAGR